MKNTSRKQDASNLRKKAEKLLEKIGSTAASRTYEVDLLHYMQELEIYEIELEIQNEELIEAKRRADIATKKYIELYDFAPNGYFTLSRKGDIIELNLLGAQMLGKKREGLVENRFALFISKDTLPVFNLFFQKVFQSSVKETCEVSLVVKGNNPICVHLSGIVSEDGEQCFVTAVDITGR